MSIRYPIDLGHKADNNYPYMSFDIVKFRDRNWIKDSAPASSGKIEKPKGDIKLSQHPPTVLERVYLPLPDNVQNNYSHSWEMTDLRMIEGIRDVLRSSSVLDGAAIIGKTMASLTVGDTFKKIAALTPNPKKQALYNGSEPRSFSWQWTFLPYSQQESEIIDNIIKTFTKHSLPSIENNSDSFFNFPAEFGIHFRNVKGFPVINYCVCQNVSVGYSQSNTQLMDDGYTSQITLSMSFLETDLKTTKTPGV